jgi:hypothetical protein
LLSRFAGNRYRRAAFGTLDQFSRELFLHGERETAGATGLDTHETVNQLKWRRNGEKCFGALGLRKTGEGDGISKRQCQQIAVSNHTP